MAPSRVLKGNFHIRTNNAVFYKYLGSWKESCPGSWKESWQGSWKELKMNLFGDNFWTAGDRGWNFAGWCMPSVSNFWLNFRSLLPIASELSLFLWFENFDPNLHMCNVNGLWGPPGLILVVKFEFQWLMLLLAGNLPLASKNLKFVAKIQWSWKEIVLTQLGQIVLDFDKFDLNFPGCEATDINEFNLFNNLTVYDLCEQNVSIYL